MRTEIGRGVVEMGRKRIADCEAFTEAYRADVYGCTLSIPQYAAFVGESVDSVYKYLGGERKPHPGSLGVHASVTGRTAAVEIIAAAAGMVAVPAPSLGDATVGELCDAIAAQGKCFEHLGEIYGDGVVDQDECEAGCTAIDESIRALLALKHKLAADCVHPECRTMAEALKRGGRGRE